MTDKTMPPLPSGSVDAAALHQADKAGTDLPEAISAATVRKEPAAPSPEPVAVGTGGYELTATGGGWWQITGPDLDEPEKIQGEEAARSRFNSLVSDVADGSADPSPLPGDSAGDQE